MSYYCDWFWVFKDNNDNGQAAVKDNMSLPSISVAISECLAYRMYSFNTIVLSTLSNLGISVIHLFTQMNE